MPIRAGISYFLQSSRSARFIKLLRNISKSSISFLCAISRAHPFCRADNLSRKAKEVRISALFAILVTKHSPVFGLIFYQPVQTFTHIILFPFAVIVFFIRSAQEVIHRHFEKFCQLKNNF